MKHKLVLIILDGFGISNSSEFNAVKNAKTPNINKYLATYPNTLIHASGEHVGLSNEKFGNSEVGHLNIGAGRIVQQDISKIDDDILNDKFANNSSLVQFFNCGNKNVHILGLLSDGGVHSHISHIIELIKISDKPDVNNIFLHIIFDGRDTPPQSAAKYLEIIYQLQIKHKKLEIATIHGRFYAMDRDNRIERIEKSYMSIMLGVGQKFSSAKTALEYSYKHSVYDEFVVPEASETYQGVMDDDCIIFANFRSDRMRQISSAIIENKFSTVCFKNHVSMTDYGTIPLVLYKRERIHNTIGEYLSNLGLKQLRIAETEKYPHVTHFMNGGQSTQFVNEYRLLVDSNRYVATYDLLPEMSLPKLSQEIVKAVDSNEYDLIIANIANADMVGHTGNYKASVDAVVAIDRYLGKIIDAIQANAAEAIITADHGNCEEMFDFVHKQPHTQHTTNLVPFIYIGRPATIIKHNGSLKDIAPTLLYAMNIKKPLDMTGESIIDFKATKTLL